MVIFHLFCCVVAIQVAVIALLQYCKQNIKWSSYRVASLSNCCSWSSRWNLRCQVSNHTCITVAYIIVNISFWVCLHFMHCYDPLWPMKSWLSFLSQHIHQPFYSALLLPWLSIITGQDYWNGLLDWPFCTKSTATQITSDFFLYPCSYSTWNLSCLSRFVTPAARFSIPSQYIIHMVIRG